MQSIASFKPRDIATEWWWLTSLLLVLTLIVPFFLTSIPPVLDYPNHLARAFLLGPGRHDPALSHMYTPHWGIIPNLAIDIVLPQLLFVFAPDVSGRIILGASLLLPICGVIVYNFSLFGRPSFWSICSVLIAFNAGFLLGFMNFLLGTGVAFLVAAGWVRWRERYPLMTISGATSGTIIVFFCHIISLILLVTLIGSWEADRLLSQLRTGQVTRPTQMIGQGILPIMIFLPAAFLYFFSSVEKMDGSTEWIPLWKALLPLVPVMNYSLGLDAATALTLFTVIYVSTRRGWLQLPRSTGIALSLLLIACLISPFRAKGGAFFDTRFALMVGYLLFAGLAERQFLPRAMVVVGVACFFTAFGMRMVLLSVAWLASTQENSELRSVVSSIKPGDRVLVSVVLPKDAPEEWDTAPFWRRLDGILMTGFNIPAWLLMQQHAFSPILFTDPSQQPIAVLPPYHKIATLDAEWGPPRCSLLVTPSPESKRYPYLANWQSNFDYVLILDADEFPDCIYHLPDELKLVRWTNSGALFQIPHFTSNPSKMIGPHTLQ